MLRQVARKIVNFKDPGLKVLIDDLFKVMKEKNGAGLAAPQIGHSVNIFVYGFERQNPRYPDAAPIPLDYVINPEILEYSEDKEDFEEGCLSFPGLRGLVSRSTTIVFRANDLNGNVYQRKAEGFAARVIQHETDHLNGILLVDRARNLREVDKASVKPKINYT